MDNITYQIYSAYVRTIKEELKKHIKGSIKCHIAEDTIIVDIFGVNDIVFRYTYKLSAYEIVQGFSCSTLAQIIVKRYKSYINNLYFL